MSQIKKSLKLFASILVYAITGLLIGGLGSLTYATMDIFDQNTVEAGAAILIIIPLFGLLGAGLGAYIGYERSINQASDRQLRHIVIREELRARATAILKEKFLLALSVFAALTLSLLSVLVVLNP